MKKNFKTSFLVCASLLLGFTASARADEGAKLAKIDAILDASHVDRLIQQTMDQLETMTTNQIKQLKLPDESRPAAEELRQKVVALVAGKLNWQSLKPVYVRLYADTFTEEELGSILDFYRTPAGQALLDKMPLLFQKTMETVQDLIKDLIPETSKMFQDFAKKYKSQ
jgi:hypothetical protein